MNFHDPKETFSAFQMKLSMVVDLWWKYLFDLSRGVLISVSHCIYSTMHSLWLINNFYSMKIMGEMLHRALQLCVEWDAPAKSEEHEISFSPPQYKYADHAAKSEWEACIAQDRNDILGISLIYYECPVCKDRIKTVFISKT